MPTLFEGLVEHATFSGDGRWMATAGGDHQLVVWNTAVWSRQSLQDAQHSVNWAGSCPNDSSLRVTASDLIRFYRYSSGAWRQLATGQDQLRHTDDVAEAEFTPNGDCLVSSGYDGRVLVWDVRTRGVIGEIPVGPVGNDPDSGDSSPPVAVFSRDGLALYTFGLQARVHRSRAWAPLEELIRDTQPPRRNLRPLLPSELEP